jgi:hypothetical protein
MSSTETHLADMGHQCQYCKGRSFRRSRLKGKDWSTLLIIRFPVRCMTCSQRQSVGLRVALRSVSAKTKQVRASTSTGHAHASTNEGTFMPAQPLGGGSFPTLRPRQSVAMPDLRGVTLEHYAAVQHETDEHRAG